MSSTAALILGGLAAAGGVASSVIGSNAAKTASNQQVAQENKALDVQQQALDYTKQVESPFIGLGNTSVASLSDAIKNGTFGPGSLKSPNIGTFDQAAPNLGTFTLPTAADAAKTPGYQFALDQGLQGVNRGAAAAGGAFTGGTLKAGAGYAQGLASNTYQDTVQNALAGFQTNSNARLAEYNAGLAGYQTNTNAQLQAYQAELAKQAQEYQQLITPITIGQNAASGTASNVANLSNSIGGTFGNIGQSQAAGTVGSANAITSGITGGTNSITQSLLLNSLINSRNPSATGPQALANANNPDFGPYGTYTGGGSYSVPYKPWVNTDAPG